MPGLPALVTSLATRLRSAATWISPPSKPSAPACTTSTSRPNGRRAAPAASTTSRCCAPTCERTIRFYQGVLEFPLTEIFENRDYQGSNHFFFDVGNGNLLAFFDFPGLDLGPYAEVLGGLHHLAISVTPEKWDHLRANLDAAGVEYLVESGTSMYFRDPDGARLELLADPLGEMYGTQVL